MLSPLPLLERSDFPPLSRGRLETLQVNLGYRCNQACHHCHVDAGPRRTEEMSPETVAQVLAALRRTGALTLDVTGGAPELHPSFRSLVREARALGTRVMDRCNLTVLLESGQEDTARFLAEQGVEVIASLPCYLEENVDRQRGSGVFVRSIRGLRRLNALGYGRGDPRLPLHLVYNPQGPSLPGPQSALEADYRAALQERHGVSFDRLLTLANLPIARFGHRLIRDGAFEGYLALLRGARRDENLRHVMCRSLVSIDWRGRLYDCDFNQALGLPLGRSRGASHVTDLAAGTLEGASVATGDHCYACIAGQGSSCGGALDA